MSSTAIREWTIHRLSTLASDAAPNASHGPPPAQRTSQYISRIAAAPNTTEVIRQPIVLSPNTLIPPAITSFASCGCSPFGSVPDGDAPAYASPFVAGLPAITRAAET